MGMAPPALPNVPAWARAGCLPRRGCVMDRVAVQKSLIIAARLCRKLLCQKLHLAVTQVRAPRDLCHRRLQDQRRAAPIYRRFLWIAA